MYQFHSEVRKFAPSAIWELSTPDTPMLERVLTKNLADITISELEELHGGLSGSHVYRVKANVRLSLFNASHELPLFVMKTNFKDSFHKEAVNYAGIPSVGRPYFCKINLDQLHPISKDRTAFFMIMQDLSGFNTLHSAIHVESLDLSIISKILDKLYNVLEFKLYMPKEESASRISNSSGIVKSLYVASMKKTLKSILESKRTLNPKNLVNIHSCLDKLFKREIPEPPYLTMMHGDLHSRNVMIHIVNNLSVDVKFIDIDKLTMAGDYMYDLGELAIHATLVGRIFEIDSPFLDVTNYDNFNSGEKSRLETIERIIESKTFGIASRNGEKRDDARIRYNLSKARFLLTHVLLEPIDVKAQVFCKEALNILEMCISSS